MYLNISPKTRRLYFNSSFKTNNNHKSKPKQSLKC